VTVEKINMLTYRRNAENATQQEDGEIQLDIEDSTPEFTPTPPFAEASDSVREVLDAARQATTRSRRVYVDSVHVLQALLCESNGIASRALANMGIDCPIVERSLRETVSRDETPSGFVAALEAKSAAAAKWLDQKVVGTEHLLLALCQIRPSAATDILTRLGAQPRDICKEVFNILDHADDWQGWLADHPDM
jgi:ATP-dependent Clp protease ATP-binding subunit ClpC